MLPIQHITKKYKVKFPAAVSLCASCRHSGGDKYLKFPTPKNQGICRYNTLQSPVDMGL